MPVGPFSSFEECVETLLDENPELTEAEARRICGSMEQEATMHDVTTKTTTKTAGGIVTREDDDGDEMRLIEVPISSTRPDRDGDEFAEEALVGMRNQIRNQQPLVFLNHGFTEFEKPLYDARDTVGTLMDAKITEAKNADENTEEKDLVAHINPDSTHPEGERMLEQVRDGQAIKFSVGFRVLDAEQKNPEDDGDDTRVFKSVDLMETSKVGIPANPDATAEVAAKAATAVERLEAAGYDLDDPGEAAALLADHLVTGDAVDSDTVREATPTDYDGEAEPTTRDATPTEGKAPEDFDMDEDELRDIIQDEIKAALDTEAADESPDDDGDGAQTGGDDPPETFEVEVDGETREFTPDEIREFRAAYEELSPDDVDDSQTHESPRDDDEVVDPEETDDADADSAASDNQTAQHLLR